MPAASTDRKIDKLIHLMVKNAMVVVPGPKIAAEIGGTRSTVWQYIEKLRGLGVEIKGHPSSGYQLEKLPDILVPSLIKLELGESRIGHRILHYFKTNSTNDVALDAAAKGAEHGTVVIAEDQTAGRGRLGRTWYSEKSSGIYVSILLRPPLAPSAAPLLTLLAGVAVHQAIRSVTGLAPDIRWPNDVLVNGRKVCGILTEMNAEVDRIHAVVLGIGINVNHREMPEELKPIATSLRIEAHKSISRAQLLAALLKEVEKLYELLLREGSAPIVEHWAAASSFARGKAIRVLTASGEYRAETVGLDQSGALRVRRSDGREELLVAGEIVEVK
ncbi:MAG: biotin--[acetyl-CoA-carboxylase] ligase [Terriglobia bacterium]|jgi:BirA family biotin operon repressor/biotin-[acetyl-CoA-carboxylase] ligase